MLKRRKRTNNLMKKIINLTNGAKALTVPPLTNVADMQNGFMKISHN